MEPNLDRVFAACLWAGLSVVGVTLAARLAFEWQVRVAARSWAARTQRALFAGLSLGTAIWAAHVFSGVLEGGGHTAGHLPLHEIAIWLTAIAVAVAGLVCLDPERGSSWLWVPAAFALATTLVGLQMFGVWSVSGLSGDAKWQVDKLLMAWACGLFGSMLAFGMQKGASGRDRSSPAWVNAGSSLALGAGIVASQHFTAVSADWGPQAGVSMSSRLSAGVMLLLALPIGAVVLIGGLRLLRQRLTSQLADAKARRTLGTKLLSDPLTGLPNRPLFEGTLTQAVQRADADNHSLALLFINLDGFRPLNQSVGHRGGDKVLCKIAARLRALSGPHMAARLASDEFLILVAGNPGVEDVSKLASRVLESVSRPFEIDGRSASVSCSIGIAMYPDHGAMSTLIRHAEAAMRAAKSAGGASHVFFEPRMLAGSREDAVLLRDLRQALAKAELELFYQPKIHAPSGEITGAEALLRWNHPVRGMVSPAVFIPLAERYGLINELGRWVINEACRQVRVWRDEGLRMRVAINLSVHQLRQADLAEHFEEVLQRHQINPDLITCELTESSAMDDTEVTMRVLGQLDLVGVHISIDDFGTGHSSLAYLRKLPADELKIDRSFVLDLETNEDARKVASAVINLAKALDLKVVAEGVETEAQNRILREYGCDQLQGYLFAKPMSAKALSVWAMEDVGPRTMNFRASLFKETGTISVAGMATG